MLGEADSTLPYGSVNIVKVGGEGCWWGKTACLQPHGATPSPHAVTRCLICTSNSALKKHKVKKKNTQNHKQAGAERVSLQDKTAE